MGKDRILSAEGQIALPCPTTLSNDEICEVLSRVKDYVETVQHDRGTMATETMAEWEEGVVSEAIRRLKIRD